LDFLGADNAQVFGLMDGHLAIYLKKGDILTIRGLIASVK
jgi:hypothetical protein